METKTIRPFGWKDKIGYMFGDFGNDFTFIFASLFLMVFYTKVLGVSPEVVGTLFLVARCVDAVTDVTMGRIVDRLKPGKNGRFRPWLLRMCGPVAVASFLMYQGSMAEASMTIKVIYMFVTYLLWGSVCYTAINIPYGSMASVLSEDADDRASLSTFRSLGALLAQLVVGVGAPLLVYTTDAAGNQLVEGGRMTLIAGIFSVFAIICYIVCYCLTVERVKVEPSAKEERVSLLKTIEALFTNRALLGIILAAILLLLASLLTQSVNQYVFIDYFNDKNALSIMGLAGLLPSFLIVPLVKPLTKKFGKKEISAVGCIIAGAASIFLFVLRVKSAFLFIVISILGYLGFGFFNMVIWAFVTDVIDDQEVRTGRREDGMVYAIYSFSRKIGQALAGGFGAFALAMVGYDSSVQIQTEAVTNGIYNVATLLPGLLYIGVGLCLIFVYPLSKKRVDENVAILKQKRENN